MYPQLFGRGRENPPHSHMATNANQRVAALCTTEKTRNRAELAALWRGPITRKSEQSKSDGHSRRQIFGPSLNALRRMAELAIERLALTEQSIKEEKTADDNAGSSADTKECIPDAIEGTPQFACSVQMTEIYIPVQDCQSPRANVMLNVKEENEQLLCGGNYPAFDSPNTAGISSEASDPLANDDLPAFTEDEKLFNSCKMTIDSMTGALGPSTPDKVLMETTPTSCMLKERNVRIDLSNDSIAPSVSVTDTQSKTVASHAGDGRNMMDEDLDEGSATNADKITSNSKPDDRISYMKHSPASKNSGNRATMPVVRGRGDAPNITASLRLIRISENRRIGIELDKGDKKEKSDCLLKNTSDGNKSNEKLYHCSHCRCGFNTKNDLKKHWEIHSVSSNLDLDDDSSMGKDESITIPASSEENNNSCESSTSETLIGLRRKRQGPMQKENTSVVKISGGMGEEKTVGRVSSSGGDGKPYTQNTSSKSTSCAENLQNHGVGGTKGGPFHCSLCNKYFAVSSSLSNHMRTHKGRKHPCGICGKSFATISDLTKHMPAHTLKKPYSCKICCKSFRRRSLLTQHMCIHSGEKPYSCSDCMKSFSRKDRLVMHLRTHTGEKPFLCNYCAKSFSRNDKLKMHLTTHTGEKPFLCNYCAKTFTGKDKLVLHLRIHSGERPFSCNDCAQCFASKSGLVMHLRTHTGEKPFTCKVCGRSFNQRSNLNRHMVTHSGVKAHSCNYCAKCFNVKGSLIDHLRTHTGERPFTCKVCCKSFCHNSSLRNHMLTHSGKKAYSCDYCAKSFSRKSRLIEHLGTHA
ncbi:oocyte zinc finger protein XlCOF22-like isoform X2 [Ischnura elegans]|uniref:oocyte zinc finger protein XlCOF22-like isoform X2 n=1 Tax=Ischnura elegans TaxID=197161 RepID=UPI001ED8AE91|nr:oocyte zinc finger protein XlCOF22-like isoform X2 [Ischnura elegans]